MEKSKYCGAHQSCRVGVGESSFEAVREESLETNLLKESPEKIFRKHGTAGLKR